MNVHPIRKKRDDFHFILVHPVFPVIPVIFFISPLTNTLVQSLICFVVCSYFGVRQIEETLYSPRRPDYVGVVVHQLWSTTFSFFRLLVVLVLIKQLILISKISHRFSWRIVWYCVPAGFGSILETSLSVDDSPPVS